MTRFLFGYAYNVVSVERGVASRYILSLVLVTIIHAINIREYSTSMSDNFPHAHFLLMILPVLPNCSNGETLS